MKNPIPKILNRLRPHGEAADTAGNAGRQLRRERRGFRPGLAVAALIIAFGFWVYVRSVVEPYTTVTLRRIPIEFSGQEELREDRSLMVDVVNTPMADITFYGRRSELTELERDGITLTVDLSGIRQAGAYELPYKITFADGLNVSSLTENGREPAYISFTVAKLSTVTVPVKGVLNGEQPVAEGYLAGTMTFDPAEITIKGPEELVSSVTYAQVELQRENLSATVVTQTPFVLIDDQGQIVESDEISCSAEEITVTQPVVMTKSVPLSIELISGGGATSKNAITGISPASVTLSGDAETLAGVNQIVLDPIDLSQVIGSYTVELPILIPNNTENLSGETEATVTVELKGLTTKVFRVTNIEMALPEGGLPEGLQATCITSSLQVYVRAPDEIIEQIYANNIRAVADLSNYMAVGQYSIPVEVYIDGYTDAGVLDTYEVVVRVTSSDGSELIDETSGLGALSGYAAEEAPATSDLVEHIAEAQKAGVESGSKE